MTAPKIVLVFDPNAHALDTDSIAHQVLTVVHGTLERPLVLDLSEPGRVELRGLAQSPFDFGVADDMLRRVQLERHPRVDLAQLVVAPPVDCRPPDRFTPSKHGPRRTHKRNRRKHAR